MQIAILSRGPRLYSTKRLKEAALKRGHTVRVMDTMKFSVLTDQGKPELMYDHKIVRGYDAVIPRIGASISFFGLAVVRQFEMQGVFCANSSVAIRISRDKLQSVQALSRHRIGIPKTAFVKYKAAVMDAIREVGGAPCIIKLLEGTQGVGVILAETEKVAHAIVETLQSTRQNVLIQNFVAESKGEDYRAFVVGGKVVAAMKRKAKPGEYRSNVHQGASTEAVQLDEEYERTAIQAAQIMGLRIAGVDMLRSKEGPRVLEVNSSPGLEGIEGATGIDVADHIVRHIEEQVNFPDIDIRQRLTLKQGYGVVEFPVGPQSELANKRIRDCNLKDREMLVLSILRGSQVVSSPAGDNMILPGDILLCYGKLLTLRTLIPQPSESRTGRPGSGKRKSADRPAT